VEWYERRSATEILADMSTRTADIPGVVLEFRKQEDGPSSGKPVKNPKQAIAIALSEAKLPMRGQRTAKNKARK
jgi:multidrug efflux pump